MKRALFAAAALTLAAAGGCGWQMQNMQGNHCVDNGACGPGGAPGGRLGQRIGNGQLRDRLAAGVHSGPAHIQGDFLSCLAAHHHQQAAAPPDGPVPTTTYPYYTVRGPRDYFLNDPMPLGY